MCSKSSVQTSGYRACNVRSVGRIVKQTAAVTRLDPKKYHPHLLRHRFSTHCHHNGMPVEVINMLLGRAKLSTTIMYLQVSTNRMRTSYNWPHPHGRA